ncbi:UNVERIFIED_ORG: hypothetical protein GGR78_000198 [Xanthomonas campestris]
MSDAPKPSIRTDIAQLFVDRPLHVFIVACVLFCCLLALCWVGDVHAACSSDPAIIADAGCADEGLAAAASYAAANAYLPAAKENGYTTAVVCNAETSGSSVSVPIKWTAEACNGPQVRAYSRSFDGGLCANRSTQTGWLVDDLGAKCYQGCTYAYDPSSQGFSPSGNTCASTGKDPPPKLDSDGDGVPDDSDAFPNDPSESTDSDGDGIGDNGDTAPDDADNGADGGSGNESDNTASGGGTCDAPPSCSGDGIACNALYQQWRTRCAVEGQGGKVTGNPGDCRAPYTCEGNPTGCAQIAVQRASLCQGTGTETGPGGAVSGGGNCSQPYACTGDAIGCAQLRQAWVADCRVKSLFDGDGDDDNGTDRNPSDFIGVSDSPNTSLLDAGGWLGSRSCPALNDAAFSGLGTSVATGIRALCDGASALAAFVLVLAYLHASWIIGRSVTGGGA